MYYILDKQDNIRGEKTLKTACKVARNVRGIICTKEEDKGCVEYVPLYPLAQVAMIHNQ